MTEELHILEIPVHELRIDDWYTEMGTEALSTGLWWRILTDVKVYGDEGNIRNQVHLKFAGDDATYASLISEMVLVRGLKSDYHAMHDPKEHISVSEDTKQMDEERYTKEDFEKALAMADIREHLRVPEYIEVARAQRLGYIRQTTAGDLNDNDRGKTVYLDDLRRTPQLLTHSTQYETSREYVFLVLDGYVERVIREKRIYVDDSPTPQDS